MRSKKIILFIVEGITDKTCLGYIVDKLLSNNVVKFEITEGDITTARGNNETNIPRKICDVIKHFSGDIFKPKDFFEVVHLIDMDGAFILDKNVIYKNCKDPYYTENSIFTNNVSSIIKRNEQKIKIINRLIKLPKVWNTIPYSVYFFSCNLDHVMYNQNNLTNIEKSKFADNFLDRYGDNPNNFLKFINNENFAVKGNYNETWNFIKADTNSLKRYTNFHLYFNNPKNSRN